MDIENKGKEFAKDAGKKIEDVVSTVAEKAGQAQKVVSENVQKADKEARRLAENARNETGRALRGAEECIRENPMKHVLLAGFVGFLLGILVRK